MQRIDRGRKKNIRNVLQYRAEAGILNVQAAPGSGMEGKTTKSNVLPVVFITRSNCCSATVRPAADCPPESWIGGARTSPGHTLGHDDDSFYRKSETRLGTHSRHERERRRTGLQRTHVYRPRR